MRVWILALFASVLVSTAAWSATIKVSGQLSNEDFYKAVSCGAAPGKACAEDIFRWSRAKAARLTVSLHFPDDVSANIKAAFIGALSNGIQQMNDAGTSVNLSRVSDNKRADIIINVIDPDAMALLNGLSGGDFVSNMNVSGRPTALKQAQVSINERLSGRPLQSIVVSNLMSSLGFLHNVVGGPYTNNSLMAGRANAQTRVTGQDLIALRMLYPK